MFVFPKLHLSDPMSSALCPRMPNRADARQEHPLLRGRDIRPERLRLKLLERGGMRRTGHMCKIGGDGLTRTAQPHSIAERLGLPRPAALYVDRETRWNCRLHNYGPLSPSFRVVSFLLPGPGKFGFPTGAPFSCLTTSSPDFRLSRFRSAGIVGAPSRRASGSPDPSRCARSCSDISMAPFPFPPESSGPFPWPR